MTGLYVSKLLALLGDIARQGRTGRLNLNKVHVAEAGTLLFTGGLLARFTAPATDTQPAGQAADAITALRNRIAQSILAAAGQPGAMPGFSTAGGAVTPPLATSITGLNAADLAIDLCRRIDDHDLLDRHIDDLRPERLIHAGEPPVVQPHASLGAVEGFLLSRADGSVTCQELLDTSTLGEIATLRALVALRVVGLLTSSVTATTEPSRPAAAPPQSERAAVGAPQTAGRLSSLDRFLKKTEQPASPAPPQPATGGRPRAPAPTQHAAEHQREREELNARCRSLDGLDHYGVLGVDRQSDESAIRRAYYQLARKYHPDRLLKPHLDDIHRQLEGMFAAFTEAYNTLTDATARAEYDRFLSTRAAGGRKESGSARTASARDAYLRGRKEMEAGRLFEALRLFESAIERDPTRAEYFHHLGVCQGENPRWRKKAEENLRKAIELNPGAVQTYVALARVYHKGGLERKSLESYEIALKWDPTCAEALVALGRAPADSTDTISTGMLRSLFKKD